MIDLHCHLLPYVDDGANDLEEALKLLALTAKQGVTELCLTPHLRQGMFETPDEKIRAQFERLLPAAEELGLVLHLSREYHWDELTREKLADGSIIPMGQNVLLTEFSARHSAEDMRKAVETIVFHSSVPVIHALQPLIAHAERYPAATAEVVRELREMGALIQVNADAILGYDGRFLKRAAWNLLKEGLVDVVASDAHSLAMRPPRMQECFTVLRKKLGEEQAEKLLLTNPKNILQEKR